VLRSGCSGYASERHDRSAARHTRAHGNRMTVPFFVAVACMVLFFRAADYEHMSPWTWSLASLGTSAILMIRGRGIAALLLGQLALFGVMWWYNMRRQSRRPK
jgi:hypothetical protein